MSVHIVDDEQRSDRRARLIDPSNTRTSLHSNKPAGGRMTVPVGATSPASVQRGVWRRGVLIIAVRIRDDFPAAGRFATIHGNVLALFLPHHFTGLFQQYSV